MPIDYTKRAPAPDPVPAAAAAPAAPASGGKVVLTKSAPTVSLTKQGASISGELRINLNWNARPPGAGGGGFLKRLSGQTGAIDLDLGCLYELTNGKKGVVQALGNAFRSQNTGGPIISLDGDDRSGANSAGETMRIDLSRLAEIKRILVFAMIYEGDTNWAAADGVVTVYPVGASPIEVRLDGDDKTARVCGIALLTRAGNDLSVQREVNYVQGSQSALDKAYGWGMQWHAGHK